MGQIFAGEIAFILALVLVTLELILDLIEIG